MNDRWFVAGFILGVVIAGSLIAGKLSKDPWNS